MIYIIAGLAVLIILDKLVYNGPIKWGGCTLLLILFTIYFVHGCLEEQEKIEEQNQRYPFDEYDDAFYDMEPLETYLKKFIRENVKDF